MAQHRSKNENLQDPPLRDVVSQGYPLSSEDLEIQLAKEIEGLIKNLGLSSGSKLLEAGSGSGHLSGYLASKGYDTTLLDFNKLSLQNAEEYYKRSGLQGNFILADIFEMSGKNIGTYDVVWNSCVLEHFDGWQILQIMKEMSKVSEKWVIILVPNSRSSPYLSFRKIAMEKGQRKWELEILRESMKEGVELAGLEFVEERFVGKGFCKEFIKFVASFNKEVDYNGGSPDSDDQAYLYALIAKPKKIEMSLEEQIEVLKKFLKLELESLRKTYYHDISLMTKKIIQFEELEREFVFQQKLLRGYRNSKMWKLYNLYLTKIRGTIAGKILQKIMNHVMSTKLENNVENKNKDDLTELHINVNQLQSILNQHKSAKGIIVYAHLSDWNAPLFQRPHHIATYLSQNDWLCFYCSSNQYDDISGFQKIKDNLYLSNQCQELVGKLEHFITIISSGNLVYTISQLEVLKEKAIIVYDFLDEISVAREVSKKTSEVHKYLLENCDIVIATSEKLYNQALTIRKKGDKLFLLPNAADYNHFHIKRDPSRIPDLMKKIASKSKPVVGYFGALASWFDYKLVRYVATKREDLEFVLIGWDYDGGLIKNDLIKMHNVHYLGAKEYSVLPQYAVWFDVCIIPFVVNHVTKATSPVKLFEYMALGIPIVTTELDEAKKYSSVLMANDYDDFSKKIDTALNLKNDEKYKNLLDKEATANTWEIRSQKLNAILNQSLSSKQNPKKG